MLEREAGFEEIKYCTGQKANTKAPFVRNERMRGDLTQGDVAIFHSIRHGSELCAVDIGAKLTATSCPEGLSGILSETT